MKPPELSRIAPDVRLGRDVTIHGFVDLMGGVSVPLAEGAEVSPALAMP